MLRNGKAQFVDHFFERAAEHTAAGQDMPAPAVCRRDRVHVCRTLGAQRNFEPLVRRFQQAGGAYMLGDTAVRYEMQGDRIAALYTNNHGDIAFEANDYVLATGSYFSQGLVAAMDGVREPLFGLDVACAADRGAWYDRDLFAAQPFETFGVRTDDALHGLLEGRPVENLRVIGAGLAGFNPVKEGCGAGVSMLTALEAARRILEK